MLGACWGASTCIRLTQLCKTKQAQTKHRKQGCAPQVCLANASDARSSARSGKLKKGITIRGAQSRGMLGACWGASTCIRITQLCTIKQAQTKHRKQRCASDVYWQMHQTHAALQVQASSNKVSQSGVRARGMLGTCWGASTCIRLTQLCKTKQAQNKASHFGVRTRGVLSKCIRLTQLCKTKQAQTKYHNQGCAPEACLAHAGVKAHASDSRSSAQSSKLKQSIAFWGAHQRHAWRMLGCKHVHQAHAVLQDSVAVREQALVVVVVLVLLLKRESSYVRSSVHSCCFCYRAYPCRCCCVCCCASHCWFH